MMHIDETTHEHAKTAQVFSYDADYDVDTTAVRWTANIRQGADARWTLSGSVPLTFPGIATMAEQVVRDAVVAEIDALESGASSFPKGNRP